MWKIARGVLLKFSSPKRTWMRPSRNTTICQFSAKRQRAEVEVEDQSPEELKQFQGAKDKEPDQWLAETIKRF